MDNQKETEHGEVLLPRQLDDDVLRYVMECAGLNNPDGARLVKAVHHFMYEALRTKPAEQDWMSTLAMADCMDMVRQELVEAGVIDASVPPMFVTEAVLQHVIGLQRKLIDANAEIAALLLARDAPRNFCGRCGKHLNVAGVHTCTPPTENQE